MNTPKPPKDSFTNEDRTYYKDRKGNPKMIVNDEVKDILEKEYQAAHQRAYMEAAPMPKRPPANPPATLDVAGQKWAYRISPTKQENWQRHEGKTWDLVVKLPTGEVRRYLSVFWYTTGYDQYQNSGQQYYLEILDYGGRGNGGGQKSATTPYLRYQEKEFLGEILSGKHYNKETQKKYKDVMMIEKPAKKQEAAIRNPSFRDAHNLPVYVNFLVRGLEIGGRDDGPVYKVVGFDEEFAKLESVDGGGRQEWRQNQLVRLPREEQPVEALAMVNPSPKVSVYDEDHTARKQEALFGAAEPDIANRESKEQAAQDLLGSENIEVNKTSDEELDNLVNGVMQLTTENVDQAVSDLINVMREMSSSDDEIVEALSVHLGFKLSEAKEVYREATPAAQIAKMINDPYVNVVQSASLPITGLIDAEGNQQAPKSPEELLAMMDKAGYFNSNQVIQNLKNKHGNKWIAQALSLPKLSKAFLATFDKYNAVNTPSTSAYSTIRR